MSNNPSTNSPFIRLRPATRRKYEEASKIKRWKFTVVADAAIDALFVSDPELRRQRRKATA